MLRIISEVRPRWVVAENVRGLLSIEDGRLFAEIISSLEGEGYEVITFCIPASAANAWHRRDRIWLIAHSEELFSDGGNYNKRIGTQSGQVSESGNSGGESNATNPRHSESQGRNESQDGQQPGGRRESRGEFAPQDRYEHWYEASEQFCGMDDGLPDQLDAAERRSIYNAVGYFGWEEVSKRLGIDCREVENRLHRTNRLKALGNSVYVPLVYEIFKAIEEAENEKPTHKQ